MAIQYRKTPVSLIVYYLFQFFMKENRGDIATLMLLPTSNNIKEDPKYLKDWRKNMGNLLETAQENQYRFSEKMGFRHKNNQPLSKYEKGGTVIFKIMKSDKNINGKGKRFLRERENFFSSQGIDIRLNMKLVKVPGIHSFLFQRLPV